MDNGFVMTDVQNVAVVTAIAAITALIAIFPLNCRRQARQKPLNGDFTWAGRSTNATEMTQMQRIARLMPPLRQLPMPLP